MTSHEQNRVTKDTSARKGPKTLAAKAAVEQKAEEASRQQYLDTVKVEYERQMQTLEADHEEQIAALKAQHKMDIAEKDEKYAILEKSVVQRETLAGQSAVKKERQEHEAKITSLKADKDKLTTQKRGLNTEIHRKDAEIAQFKDKENLMQAKIEAHPNSWVQVHFDSTRKGITRRSLFFKYNTRFQIVVNELQSTIRNTGDVYDFRIEGSPHVLDKSKTLEQVSQIIPSSIMVRWTY